MNEKPHRPREITMVKGGNIFDSRCQTITNTVNCVGVMGKGLALEFRRRFPDMFEDYVRRCAKGSVKPGKPYLYKRTTFPWILNFPTKLHWRSESKIEDIIGGLRYLEQHYKEWGITSLAIPALGCGLGGLDWNIVKPILYGCLRTLDISVEIYTPQENS